MAGNLRSRTHHGFGMFWDVLSVLFLSTIWGSHNGSKVLIKSPKIWGTDEFEAKVCELFGASQRGGGAMGWSYRHRGSDSDCSNVDHYVFVPIVVKKSPFQSQSLVQSPLSDVHSNLSLITLSQKVHVHLAAGFNLAVSTLFNHRTGRCFF